MDFLPALVPGADPAAAAQIGARNEELSRHLIGRGGGALGVLEQHSSGVENDLLSEDQIKEKAGHRSGAIRHIDASSTGDSQIVSSRSRLSPRAGTHRRHNEITSRLVAVAANNYLASPLLTSLGVTP
jgi:hypothetical protein